METREVNGHRITFEPLPGRPAEDFGKPPEVDGGPEFHANETPDRWAVGVNGKRFDSFLSEPRARVVFEYYCALAELEAL